MRIIESTWARSVVLLSAMTLLAACSAGSSGASNSSSSSTSASPSAVVEESAPESSQAPTPEPMTSAPQSLRDCMDSEGFPEVLATVSRLNDQTIEITNTDIQTEADIEYVIEAFNDQGTDYDKVGRQFKAVPDCGDDKWGMMAEDLGDIYVEMGGLMSGLTVDDALYGDGVDDINAIAALIRSSSNQFEVMTEYLERSP